MNQTFRINVGQETLQGRLTAVRVGKGFPCVFYISGVENVEDVAPPKIWVGATEATARFWSGIWSDLLGLWVVTVGTNATATVGSASYAMTMFGVVPGEAEAREYIVGQGPFTVYANIAGGGGETGETGQSLGEQIIELAARLDAIEARFADLATLGMFDPENAFDIDMRNQVQAITTKLRGPQ